MEVSSRLFGKTENGRDVYAFTIANSNNRTLTVITYGATLQSFRMPDREGNVEELTLGFDTIDGYEGSHPYFGATVGRVANRISNGIFSLKGKEYVLQCNDGSHHIHGGQKGFSRKIWDAYPYSTAGAAGVKLFLESPDGDEGYPGQLDVSLTVSLNEKDTLTFQYKAVTTAPTIVNLTNHAYWNLTGAGRGKIHDHVLQIRSHKYLESDAELIPTGNILPVEGTPLDFREPKPIGKDIEAAGGYDHCFVLDGQPATEVYDPLTSRRMVITTTAPGMQLYTGNFLGGQRDRTGSLESCDAVCFETQAFPDAVHHDTFTPIILNPGETYSSETTMKFTVEDTTPSREISSP